MSKKIKLIITTFIIVLSMIILSGKTYGWSPSYQIPVFPQGNYFCKEKGAAVRFTQRTFPTRTVIEQTLNWISQQYPGSTRINGTTFDNAEKGVVQHVKFQMSKDMVSSSDLDYAGISTNNGLILSMVSGWSLLDYNPVQEDVWTVPGIIQAKTPIYSEAGSRNVTNNKEAYILSAGQSGSPTAAGLRQGNHANTASDRATNSDIQRALWADPNFNDGTILSPNELYNESVAYESYYGSKLKNYKVSITDDNAQVIANRKEKTYILGPFSVHYPDDTRFSYIENIYVSTDKNSNLQPLDILFASESSGNVYPKSGENFFVKISGSDNPSTATVNVNFAYLKETKATYTVLIGQGNITQEVGRVIKSSIASGRDHYYDIRYEEYLDTSVTPPEIKKRPVDYGFDYDWADYKYEGKIAEEVIGHYHAQNVARRDSYSRKWDTRRVSSSLDLTMELGGIVWEDSTGGKETLANGNIDKEENRIPNVLVKLYSSDGKQIATTKTNAKGQYKFTKLDAMKQYYVKFTYNGQYYQPTIYSSSETWGKSGWEANSNGTDIRKERITYNAKFASIGSSPANYETTAKDNYLTKSGGKYYNETFTKKQLLGYTLQSDGTYKKTREAVIDNFGNLILEKSNDTTTKKMIQYVKDCQMESSTGDGTGKFDLYPVPAIFVIDTQQYPSMLTPKAEPLYNTAYYINQGYSQREKADLALKKDIDNVTLEINGQTHKYTYDKIENKENAENTWDIALRLSDVLSGVKYYDEEYTRELYTSDYLYKASMYGNATQYGKSKSDELEVYVTYKIMVRNQSQSIRCRVDEIVDYYDEDLDYISERSYIEFKTGLRKEQKYAVNATSESRYKNLEGTTTTIEGYNNLYIQGLAAGAQRIDDNGKNIGEKNQEGIYLSGGETAYVYLTFKVKKDIKDNEDYVRLDEELETGKNIGVGKENIVEINGYSTLYKDKTEIPNVGKVDANTIAGLVDMDSNPGNLDDSGIKKDNTDKNIYAKFEDDTDKSPNIKIKLDRNDDSNRVISGVVWEDIRKESENATSVGDGIRQDNETLINGVTVQLVELMDNGEEFVWREFGDNSGSGTGTNTIGKGAGSGNVSSETPIINAYNLIKNYDFGENQKGAYAFKSFMPGKYVVRFIYGDTVKTVLPSDVTVSIDNNKVTGNNTKSYNGQDYKSTTYQTNIAQDKIYEWKKASTWVNGQEIVGDTLTKVSTFKADASNNETAKATINENNQKGYLYDITTSDSSALISKQNASDAKDIESIRNKVIDYSDNDVTNYIAEVLASHKKEYQDKNYETANSKETLLKDLMTNTKMTAETGLMVIEFEYDRGNTDMKDTEQNNSVYKVLNVDLGLEERPKAQLVIDKEITNVKLTLADGSTLFDAKQSAVNVLWQDHNTYKVGYTNNEMKEVDLQKIRNNNASISKIGLIQLSMDEELMHGATIKISYNIRVRNIGEVDYYNMYEGQKSVDRSFYYKGIKSESAKVVTTQANQVIDYVANNLQFNKADNSNWDVITTKDILANGLVNNNLDKKIEQYNTIIITDDLSKELVPELYKKEIDKNATDSVEVPLVLTQLITSENETDDLTYKNIVEIVKTSNNVGRRNEYSVVGNQDPTKEIAEIDSDQSEVVRILPPFGNAGIYIIIATTIIIAVAMMVGGIIFIKKKVIK